MASIKSPFVIVASMPINGHVVPTRAIANNLVERGYDVTMITGSSFRKSIEALGVTFRPIIGYGDFVEDEFETRFAERQKFEGLARLAFDFESLFIKSIPSQHETIQNVLKEKKEQDPDRPIVYLNDFSFMGMLPVLRGAPGIRPTGAIALGHTILPLPGPGLFPVGLGVLPDYSEEGRAKAAETGAQFAGAMHRPFAIFAETMKELGATQKEDLFLAETVMAPDRYLQSCIPELEYPRENMPKHVIFNGVLAQEKKPQDFKYPSWFEEIKTNPNKATIVMTSQSTLANDLHHISGPTLQALKDRPNTIVVLNLSTPNQVVPDDIEIPANARVGYVRYDDILPYCDAWTLNFGYGAFQHGIVNAVPMVGSGHTEDRAEIATRSEWAGIAVNLRNGPTPPTPEDMRVAVEEVLTNPKYKEKVKELSVKSKQYDTFGIIAETVDNLATGKFEKLNDKSFSTLPKGV